jgi:acetyl-CoA carboxylase biotin carboxyl carrier protein
MVLEKIKQCLEMMKDYDLREFHVKFDDFELRASRGDQSPVVVHQGAPIAHAAQPAPVAPAAVKADAPVDGNLVEITSPIVGTFYRKSSPDAPPLIDVDDNVEPDTVVCLVEAMKVFNEIKAKVSGTIVKCLVKDSEPVEYGQPLFLVRPSI